MTSNTICRFAPSPTGFLHGGNLRVALLNYLHARRNDGKFILRLDDTDRERSTAEYAQAIQDDLLWLGFSFDAIYRQSDRLALYEAAVEKLKKDGRLYACYETPEELALARKAQENAGKPPRYDRASLTLTREKILAFEQAGRKPHYRFLLEDKDMAWQDLGKGAVQFPKNIVSDPVLVRGDGAPLYTLSSVVDDGLLGVTMILRGDDHLTNTAAQIQLFAALGYAAPTMAHLPRMVDGAGGKLSKRLGAKSIKDFRAQGVHPRAILSYLAHLGLPTVARGDETMADLIASVDVKKFGKAEPKFFEDDLIALNKKILGGLDLPGAISFYGAPAMGSIDDQQWQKIRGGVMGKDDLAAWQNILSDNFFNDYKPNDDEKKLLALMAAHLPENLTADSINSFLEKIKTESGKKGKDLFHPIRLGLTGRLDGPTIADIFLLLGRAKTLARLQQAN
ncbi:MAG: glutamate--tRNA ligase [Hydrotalea sp.]|nr:glutamate--tRNA ligase [Hydrotalea sp.]